LREWVERGMTFARTLPVKVPKAAWVKKSRAKAMR
jgi:hypothetical protein